ncbi:hypothetical protein GCM10009504_05090 [Pseudomonas laurentiana]|nr:hypothetical protein GCM10009504_05090 [Pseudomonas laurentiana]
MFPDQSQMITLFLFGANARFIGGAEVFEYLHLNNLSRSRFPSLRWGWQRRFPALAHGDPLAETKKSAHSERSHALRI